MLNGRADPVDQEKVFMLSDGVFPDYKRRSIPLLTYTFVQNLHHQLIKTIGATANPADIIGIYPSTQLMGVVRMFANVSQSQTLATCQTRVKVLLNKLVR